MLIILGVHLYQRAVGLHVDKHILTEQGKKDGGAMGMIGVGRS